MSAPAQRLARELAARHGVTVSCGGGGWFEVLLTAPVGSRFEPGLHELVVAGYPDDADSVTWRSALARLRAAVRDGVEDCDDPDCEWCERGGA